VIWGSCKRDHEILSVENLASHLVLYYAARADPNNPPFINKSHTFILFSINPAKKDNFIWNAWSACCNVQLRDHVQRVLRLNKDIPTTTRFPKDGFEVEYLSIDDIINKRTN
jgi:hypothetical protein